MTRVIIVGAKGRMGQALVACAPQHRGLTLTGKVDAGDDLATGIGQADVVIDFSSHAATVSVATLCTSESCELRPSQFCAACRPRP